MKIKRRGGIATIMVTLILIMIVLACIPSLKSIVNANATASNNIKTDIINITK